MQAETGRLANSSWGPSGADIEGCLLSNRFPKYLQQLYGSPEWLFRNTGLDAEERTADYITIRDYFAVMNNLMKFGPCLSYHLDFFRKGVPFQTGPLDLASRYAPTLAASLSSLVEFGPQRHKYYQLDLQVRDGLVQIFYDTRINLGDVRPTIVETYFLLLHQMIAIAGGSNGNGISISFKHQVPEYLEELRSVLPCKLSFGQPHDRIAFPEAWLASVNPAASVELWQEGLAICRAAVANKGREVVEDVREFALAYLDNHCRLPRIADYAYEKGISPRTLIRRLHDRDTSYQHLVDEAFRERARDLLADSRLSISTIGARLGYADDSSFIRAFRRIFAMSPSVYRTNVQSG